MRRRSSENERMKELKEIKEKRNNGKSDNTYYRSDDSYKHTHTHLSAIIDNSTAINHGCCSASQ
jgi:mannose-6-phosphate isomerase-like protein (cupin superfamily)